MVGYGGTHTELDILGAFFAIALAVTPGLGEKLGTPTVQLARSFLEEMLRGSNFAKWNPNYQKTLLNKALNRPAAWTIGQILKANLYIPPP